MTPLIECVPNFSEGRSAATIGAIGEAITGVPGVALLDVHADPHHHRSVFTFAGPLAAVGEAAVRATRVATERIDLTRHRGEHPRIGATDVIPFVPLARAGAPMDDCVTLARHVGQRIASELAIPVYLYGRAATRPERASLPRIRRAGFEALRDQIGRDPDRAPDFGPSTIHPTAGATAVGARGPLVAFNVFLETADVQVAREIAATVRASGGGLRGVQALGLAVGGLAQVSMNLLEPDATPPARVLEAIRREASRRGIAVAWSEIVGLTPTSAVLGAAASQLALREPLDDRLLEPKIAPLLGPTRHEWLEALAAGTPGPGAGSAAALVAAAAAALVVMVARVALGRGSGPAPELERLIGEAEALRARLYELSEDDARAYARVVAARRAPDGNARRRTLDDALVGASEVPAATADAAARVRALARRVLQRAPPAAASDARAAVTFAAAALAAAGDAVRANVSALSEPARGAPLLQRLEALSAE